MKKNAFKLLILSGIALCGLSALALNHTTLVEDIVESTNDTLNNCLVTNVRNCQIGESSEVKVSKTYVQLGQSEDLLLLRFATAISGSIKSAYYTRTCEGLGEKTFEVSNVYRGIKAGEEIFYYDEVEGKPTTNEEVKGQYYWACYVVAFETNAYKASDFNVELTVVTEEDEEVVAESKTQSLHAAICYEDLTNSLANRNDSIVVESDVLPPEGGKAYLLNNSMQETKRYYSSINVSFKERTDIENKKIEMDFKVLGNLYKNRIQFELKGETSGATESIFLHEDYVLNGTYEGQTYNPEKCKVEIKEDGWFHVTLNIKNTWALDTYNMDHVKIGFANQDLATTANVLIANVNMTNYDLFAGTKTPEVEVPDQPEEEPEFPEVGNYHDYSDNLEYVYGATITTDTTVSHDGVQSTKVYGSEVGELNSNGVVQVAMDVQFRLGQSMASKKISFFVKFEENTAYKNRVAVRVYKDSENYYSDLKVSHQDGTLPAGVTLSQADENGWYHAELDFDALGYNQTDIYKVRLSVNSIDNGVTKPTCWFDQINVIDK